VHELGRRVGLMIEQGRLTADQGKLLLNSVHDLFDERVIEVIPPGLLPAHGGCGAQTCTS
jgi:hypothetical protein